MLHLFVTTLLKKSESKNSFKWEVVKSSFSKNIFFLVEIENMI